MARLAFVALFAAFLGMAMADGGYGGTEAPPPPAPEPEPYADEMPLDIPEPIIDPPIVIDDGYGPMDDVITSTDEPVTSAPVYYDIPTDAPTEAPTDAPIAYDPTAAPTAAPTDAPTDAPVTMAAPAGYGVMDAPAPAPVAPPMPEEPVLDVMPEEIIPEDTPMTEVIQASGYDKKGRKVIKKFVRKFSLKRPSIRDIELQLNFKCRDMSKNCAGWAKMGECSSRVNPDGAAFMRSVRGCPRSCDVCTPNRQEWMIRVNNARILRRRVLKNARGRRVVVKRRRNVNL